MRRKGTCRRGVQLIEIVLVLPMVGLVLTAVALSVAATQHSLQKMQQQALELATLDRFTQQFREDVHRAIQRPVATAQTLEIERLEGTVRYAATDDGLRRTVQTAQGGMQGTFAVAAGSEPWTIAPEQRLVRFAASDGKQIAAAWPETPSRSTEDSR